MTTRGNRSSRRPSSSAVAPTVLDSVPELTGRLAEFRTALMEEIQAARRAASSSAVSLADGRLISAVGASFQYAFRIEDNLNVPADSPGQLFVAGGHVDCTVVSVEGMTAVISVEKDLGSFVPTASLQSSLADLMKRLIDRLEDSSTKINCVGDRILDPSSTSGMPLALTENQDGLNPEQSSAVAAVLGKDTTFIWGPPGTGKTRTIGAIGRELLRRDRSVLLVSHTNTAVDQALLRIAELVSPAELANGKVIRVGDPRDPRVNEHPDLLLSTHVARRCEELAETLRTLQQDQESTSETLNRCLWLLDLCEWVVLARNEIGAMRQVVEDLALKNLEHLSVRTEWKDGKRKKLEEQLNDIVAHIYLAGEALKEKRIRDEEAARARLERERREYREYLRRQEEERKAKELSGLLEGWRLARDIREFVAEALTLGADPKVTLDWALSYADKIDPLGKLRRRSSGGEQPAGGRDEGGGG